DAPNPGAVVGATITGTANPRTGAQSFLDAGQTFGFGPRLLLAPGFTSQASVREALTTLAEKLRAVALVDVPLGATPATVMAGRAAGGAIDLVTSSPRVVLCYPHVRVADPAGGDPVLEPLSQHVAGAVAARDQVLGFHHSLSNAPLVGILGAERSLTASLTDANAETNLLNEVGVVTVLNAFGSGWRTWGNRSAAWPASAGPETFVAVRRTADVLLDSVEAAMLQYLDRPISTALIDEIAGTVNAYIRSLQARGALVDGRCTFDPNENPPEELAAGHLTFELTFMPPPPAERITFKSFIDASLLTAIAA
ncbi:MAG TPA: phage tail sheath C-terminal domain-containing protein, partial [Gaiellales bacterium]|nr:phage tail sheath C-terminal domain-containing protein [Gaiellales bacterium]